MVTGTGMGLRCIFDTVGHKSLQTQGFKVREAITPCISYAAAAE
jgi:hypothetical protein